VQSVDAQLSAAFATWILDGYAAAVPAVRAATARLLDGDVPAEKLLSHFVLGVMLCTATWDHETRVALLARVEQVARETGALNELDTAKFCVVMIESGDGHLDGAEVHLAESNQLRSVLGATSDVWEIYKYPELLAWRAREAHLNEALQGTIDAATVLGIGAMVSIAQNAIAILELGRSNYEVAFAAARQTFGIDPIGVDSRGLPNLVEAAARSGRTSDAHEALAEFESRATAAGTTWARGLLERSRALLAEPAAREEHYRRAIALLAEADARAELARAHLLYGEWLRRAKRKTDAREQLRTAHAMFSAMGAEAFAERARIELAATGEQARKRSADTRSDLTAQEQQIARLAAVGDTNSEIAERLYISARTVDYHLRKVYRKLDISSRRELRRFFPAP
jgi:DNA-binding CsgD family transcriptional regulator